MLHNQFYHPLHLILTECHLAQYCLCLVGGEALEVLLTRSDDESRHVECSRTHEILCLALSRIAIGTMLLAREDHSEIIIGNTPTHHIHHWFGVALVLGQRVIYYIKETLTALLGFALDEQGCHGIVDDIPYTLAFLTFEDGSEIAREALPTALQGEHTACACLEMGMVGSRGTAFGPIVEHHHLGIFVEQIEHLTIIAQDTLRFVSQRGDGEMCGQDGEWIDEQLEMLVDNLLRLLLGAILFT